MKNITCIFIVFLLPAVATLSAQSCTVADTCPANPVQLCDLTSNSPNLWNENYWLDAVTGLHDMPDAPANLSFTATDTCANGSITLRYILYLDLDGDAILETAVGSDSLPGFNVVNFGNALGSGTPRSFDERPVPASQKYGFALETVVDGPTTTARVRWNTAAQPGVYINPELPYGLHKIKWISTDAQGHESTCEYNFVVKDCKAPVVVCLNDLSANILPNGALQIWASDFLQYTEDNHTLANFLQLGIRKAGAGTGFPLTPQGNPATSIIFTCDDLGDNIIELWSRDQTGNADYCQTFATITDAFGICLPTDGDVAICTRSWCNDAVIGGVDYIPGTPDSFDAVSGCAFFDEASLPGGSYTVTPFKDGDDLNGVNALDLIHIARHILGLEPLGSPYAMIAADANKSNSITTFDMVEYKKLIQGIYTELPSNTSWRFLDANYNFPNPFNPFQGPWWNDTIFYTIQDSVYYFEFFGIKTGDVDCSAYPGFGPSADDRAVATLTMPDAMLLPGETICLPVGVSESGEWIGLQMGLRFDPKLLEIESITSGKLPGMDESVFANPQPGMLNVVWFDVAPQAILPAERLFTLKLKALGPVRLSEALSLATDNFASEAYTKHEATQKLQLQFSVRSEPAGETAIFSPQPNPVSEGATIPLRLAQAETVTLELTDLSGKRLWFNQITHNMGTHLLEIPASALPSAGVYVWRVQAGATTSSGKLVRI